PPARSPCDRGAGSAPRANAPSWRDRLSRGCRPEDSAAGPSAAGARGACRAPRESPQRRIVRAARPPRGAHPGRRPLRAGTRETPSGATRTTPPGRAPAWTTGLCRARASRRSERLGDADAVRRHDLLVMIGPERRRGRARIVELVVGGIAEPDRERLYRSRRMLRHQRENGGRVDAAAQERAERDVGSQPDANGLAQLGAELLNRLAFR